MERGYTSVGGYGRPFSMPNPHLWDSAKNEMVLISFGPFVTPNAQWHYDFDFFPFIAINEIPVVEGKPVLGVLHDLCRKVESILMAVEAESKRLGIVK